MGLDQRVAEATDIFAFGCYLHLKKIYEQQFDAEYAALLAEAVSNDVLSRRASNERGRAFLEKNRLLVQEKCREIGHDEYMCRAISEAVRMQQLLDLRPLNDSDPRAIKEHYDQIGMQVEKLKEYGIYIHDEVPTSFFALRRRMKKFAQTVERFYEKVARDTP